MYSFPALAPEKLQHNAQLSEKSGNKLSTLLSALKLMRDFPQMTFWSDINFEDGQTRPRQGAHRRPRHLHRQKDGGGASRSTRHRGSRGQKDQL